jgi:hypothetical protein
MKTKTKLPKSTITVQGPPTLKNDLLRIALNRRLKGMPNYTLTCVVIEFLEKGIEALEQENKSNN